MVDIKADLCYFLGNLIKLKISYNSCNDVWINKKKRYSLSDGYQGYCQQKKISKVFQFNY
jgi:hypothetical protein